MTNKIALIVTTETNLDLSFYNSDKFIKIGVERGALDIIEKNLKLDYAISDFDHVIGEELSLIESKADKLIKLDEAKDYLDGISAIELANELDVKKIIYISKPSKRMDMNVSTMEILRKYKNVEIYNENSIAFRLESGVNKIEFNNYQDYTYVSLLTLEDNNEITIKNAKFDVDKLKVNIFDSITHSNGFIPYKDIEIENIKPIAVIITK